MKGFLETTYNKIPFSVKVGYLYSHDDFWVDIRGNMATVGLSEFLQKSKGEVAFLEIIEPGVPVRRGQELGTIETTKATFRIISPVTGKLVEVNSELKASPTLINSDPYGTGWICKIELTDPEGIKGELLQAESYMKVMIAKLEKGTKKQ